MNIKSVFQGLPAIITIGGFLFGLIFGAVGSEGGKCMALSGIQPICTPISVKIVFWTLSAICFSVAILKLIFGGTK